MHTEPIQAPTSVDRQAAPYYRAVFVSPHLDDAVFSCGGAIAQLATEGPILVVNVFTAYSEANATCASAQNSTRQVEELAAAALLGYSTLNLGEIDAPMRHRAYRAPGNLFKPPLASDRERLSTLAEKILNNLSRLRYDFLYLPLGIGWHVDHVLTFLATAPLHSDGKTRFYEDAPYCLIRHASRYRLEQLAAFQRGILPSLHKTALHVVPAWYQTCLDCLAMPLLRQTAWPVRPLVAGVVGLYLWRLLAGYRREAEREDALIPLLPELRDITPQFPLKIEACYCYTSQIGQFFTDRADTIARYRRYATSLSEDDNDRIFERYWHHAV